MAKGETEVLLFMFLQDVDLIKKNPTTFEVVTLLRVTNSKARNLIYAASLRRSDDIILQDEMISLICAPAFPTSDQKIIDIEIDNPLMQDYIRNQVRQWRASVDGSFNQGILRMSYDAYKSLVNQLMDEKIAEGAFNKTDDYLYEYASLSRADSVTTKKSKLIDAFLAKVKSEADLEKRKPIFEGMSDLVQNIAAGMAIGEGLLKLFA